MPFNQKSQVCKEVGKHDPCIGKKKSIRTSPELTQMLEKMTLKLSHMCFEEFRGNIKIWKDPNITSRDEYTIWNETYTS